ncbi:universal stress protein [Noviherbaspirillum sp.]|uniref:universal stress protein n=1 Tax=Noviherbaspirillum sp. TaxID=1926288 RepID=UPI002B476EED|nr:universal stress protein [Noviherbaspirillum sp.]HJV79329.1 universal stress protein [Noviherbaspirillum sp.]
MLKILLAVDGSENSLRAAAYIIKRASAAKDAHEVQLLNVQHPLHGDISAFVGSAQVKQYHHDEGMKAIAKARTMLEQAGIAHQYHLFVGDPASTVVRCAREWGCDEIAVGTQGHTAIANLFLGSVSSKIVSLSDVPVLLVK